MAKDEYMRRLALNTEDRRDVNKIFFNEVCEEMEEINKVLKKEIRKDILSYLYAKDEPVKFSQINKDLKFSRTTLYNNLEKLKEKDLVKKEGKKPIYFELGEKTRLLISLCGGHYRSHKELNENALEST